MTQDELKRMAAQAAMKYVEDDMVVGVGSGSTVNLFIEELARFKHRIEGAIASSNTTADRLKAAGIRVLDLNSFDRIALYVDGADEVTEHLTMIKGGGGALTREKIVAAVAERFVCIVDSSKLVGVLGRFPLPIEVIPQARSYVARQMVKLGGQPQLRDRFTSDNGNPILDIRGLSMLDPPKLEAEINNVTGVVTNGIFARRPADMALIASDQGIRTLQR